MFRVRAWGWTCYAHSVVAHAIDEETGKIARARLCPDHREVLGWLHQLRGPVRVTYEARRQGIAAPYAAPSCRRGTVRKPAAQPTFELSPEVGTCNNAAAAAVCSVC